MAAMNIAPDTVEYDLGSIPKEPGFVANEEGDRLEATRQLHHLVEEVLDILGVDGRFSLLQGSGQKQIVGDPDFAWLKHPTNNPTVVVCAVCLANLCI
jgi:hypothetical protein